MSVRIAVITTSVSFYQIFEMNAKEQRAKCSRFDALSSSIIEGMDIVVIDFETQIGIDRSFIVSLPQSKVILGYFRTMDSFEAEGKPANFKELLKPIRPEHIRDAISDVLSAQRKDNANNTIGMEAEFDSLLNPDILSDQDKIKRFQSIVRKYYDGMSEAQFFEKIGVGDISTIAAKEETVSLTVEHISHKLDFVSDFVDDALNMYRIQTFQRLRLSVADIDRRIKEMIKNDAKKSNVKDFDQSQLEKNEGPFQKLSSLYGQELDSRKDDKVSSIDVREADECLSVTSQRQEAIELVRVPQTSEKELSAKRNFSTDMEPAPKSSAELNESNPLPLNKTEFSDRLKTKMTPEQIERLRRLGVKI